MEPAAQSKKSDITESLRVSYCLTISGGFFDAYTYICRDGVFANAETGNMVLLGINLAEKNYPRAFVYLIPIIAFALGVLLTEYLKNVFTASHQKKTQQISLIIESILLIIMSFLDQRYNSIVNALISFICGIQVNAFRKWHSNPFATTMCTGNLRSAIENTAQAVLHKDKDSLIKSLIYFSIILAFIAGAIAGTFLSTTFGYSILFVSAIPILLGFVMLF